MPSLNPSQISRRRLLQTGSALALTPWMFGCSNKEPLIVSGHKWLGYELLFLARDMGQFPQSGVHLLEVPNASTSMQALREGKAQAAMLTLDEVIRLCSEGYDLRVVMIFDISIGADLVVGKPEIIQPQDLIGKRIGYEDSAVGAFMLHEFLTHSLLDQNEVELVHVTPDQHLTAWESGELEALITFEPHATKLIQAGGKRLFDSRQIPDKIFDVLVINADAAQRHKSALEKIIKIHFDFLHHLRTNPMDASHRITKRLEMSANDVMQLYRGLLMLDALDNHAYLSKQDSRLVNAAKDLIRVMRDAGMIVEDCDLQTLFTNEFIPRDLI